MKALKIAAFIAGVTIVTVGIITTPAFIAGVAAVGKAIGAFAVAGGASFWGCVGGVSCGAMSAAISKYAGFGQSKPDLGMTAGGCVLGAAMGVGLYYMHEYESQKTAAVNFNAKAVKEVRLAKAPVSAISYTAPKLKEFRA